MISLICLLVPPIILVLNRNHVFNLCFSRIKLVYNYLTSAILINAPVIFLLKIFTNSSAGIITKLNNYPNYAMKYFILLLFIAFIEPYSEKYLDKFQILKKIYEQLKMIITKYSSVLLWMYSIILVLLNFIRIFDNNLWGDEAFSASLTRMSFNNLIIATANDVHPPLYYIIAKMICSIFGYTGTIYHLVSFIPYFILVLFSLIVLSKKFGKETSLIYVTFASLLDNALTYNIEVRMYSWCALFFILAIYQMYLIISSGKRSNYIWLSIYSLSTAYCHYYGLVSICCLYLFLIVYTIIKNSKKNIWNIILSSIISILGYLPWLFVLIPIIKKTASSFWMITYPGYKESFCFLFQSNHSKVYFILFIAFYVITSLYELNIVSFEKNSVKISMHNINISEKYIFISICLCCVFGTIFIAEITSKLIRPMYSLRYIYPVSVLAWFLLSYELSKSKLKKIIVPVFIVYFLISQIPVYINTFRNDVDINNKIELTVENTTSLISQNDEILTNSKHISWTIAKYYYPQISISTYIDLNNISVLSLSKKYYLLLVSENELSSKQIYEIEHIGYIVEPKYMNGELSNGKVFFYKLVKEK